MRRASSLLAEAVTVLGSGQDLSQRGSAPVPPRMDAGGARGQSPRPPGLGGRGPFQWLPGPALIDFKRPEDSTSIGSLRRDRGRGGRGDRNPRGREAPPSGGGR